MDALQILTAAFLAYGAYLAVCGTGVAPDLRDPLRGRAAYDKARVLRAYPARRS
jgi:hypothetical protein